MGEICVIFASLFMVLLLTELLFYRHIGTKKPDQLALLNKTIMESLFAYLIIIALFSGYILFWEDRALFVECRRETMTCIYSRSTEFNKTLRQAKTYDISRVQYARIAKHYRRRGTSFYTVQLAGEKHELDLPPHFSSSRAAKEEADKFNAFLQKKQSVYIFAAQPDGLPFYQKMLFFASLTGFLIAVRLLRDMFAANAGELRSGHKPNRNKGKLKRNLRKDGPSEQETEAFLKEINELSNTKPPTGKKSADTVIQRRRNI